MASAAIQTKGLSRSTIDKFYTNPLVAEECLKIFKKYVPLKKDDLILEPSAGNGSFIPGIKALSKNYLFYDLEPEHDEIIKQDYLLFDPADIQAKYRNIYVIGNPPFGRQSSTALKFIKKSTEFCKGFALILPKSFKKESFKNKIPLNFHLIYEGDIPDNSFLVNEEEYDVPCVFQIWIKKAEERELADKIEPINFEFVKKTESPHISFRRVGVYAGNIDKSIKDKSPQSHYFIKFTNGKSIDANIGLVVKIKYEFNNTVGPKSISKQELIGKFNEVLL